MSIKGSTVMPDPWIPNACHWLLTFPVRIHHTQRALTGFLVGSQAMGEKPSQLLTYFSRYKFSLLFLMLWIITFECFVGLTVPLQGHVGWQWEWFVCHCCCIELYKQSALRALWTSDCPSMRAQGFFSSKCWSVALPTDSDLMLIKYCALVKPTQDYMGTS